MVELRCDECGKLVEDMYFEYDDKIFCYKCRKVLYKQLKNELKAEFNGDSAVCDCGNMIKNGEDVYILDDGGTACDDCADDAIENMARDEYAKFI